MLHGLGRFGAAWLPASIYGPARRLGSALAAPARFSRTGHFRSALRGAPCDSNGDPLPWYTYPAIDLLAQKDFSGRSVLEFGAGHSTLWWARRAARVTSLESDPKWHGWLAERVPQNVRLQLLPDLTATENIRSSAPFDVIVIDGFNRRDAAALAISLLSPDGCLLIDNSEGHWDDEGDGYPIMDMLRRGGFSRVDFHGFVPCIAHRQCTSIAFRDKTFVFSGAENPVRLDAAP